MTAEKASSEQRRASFREAEARLFKRSGVAAYRDHSFPFSNATMRVLDVGPRDGEATLYVHGGGGCAAFFAPLIDAISKNDGARRHLVPDRPGFGLSDFVPLDDEDFRRHAVAFLTTTIDRMQVDRVDVVANSMGGLWSLWFALDRPERVRSLSLLGAPAFVGGGSAPLPLRLLGNRLLGPLMMKMQPPSPKQARDVWKLMGHDPSTLDDTIHDVMLALEELPHYARGWLGLLARALKVSGPRPDVVFLDEDLSRIRCPTTWIWGKGDPFGTVALGERAAALAQNAPFVVVGQGHLPWLDEPGECARTIAESWRARSHERPARVAAG